MLSRNPFLSDKSLASHFGVSPQTVRLDRMALGIPDQRARTKKLAEMVYGRVKSLPPREIIGELLDVELGKSAISVMEATPEMAFERSGIIRSHYIFAQADSLAFSVMDAGNVVTGIANLKFKRPVRIGEKLVAKAQVIRTRGNKSVVLVETRSRGDLVFRAKFLMFALDDAGHGSGSQTGRPFQTSGASQTADVLQTSDASWTSGVLRAEANHGSANPESDRRTMVAPGERPPDSPEPDIAQAERLDQRKGEREGDHAGGKPDN